MICSIVINHQLSLTGSNRSAPDAKVKDPERQRRGKKPLEMFLKKLRERFLKDNQKAQMALKEYIEYFQQDLNDPAST